MIRRLLRYTIRYSVLTLVGFAVARVVDVIRQSSDPSVAPPSGSDRAPFPTKASAEPVMTQGETATPPHGDPLSPPPSDEKPPSSPPPAGNAGRSKKAPAAKKVPTKRAPAPPRPPTGDSPAEEPKGGS